MNPGFEKHDEYIKYRNIIKKIKSLQSLDGIDINDTSTLEYYKKNSTKIAGNSNSNSNSTIITSNLYSHDHESDNLYSSTKNNLDPIEELDENEINNLIKQKKRHSTITYSQRMLKKADNLTKFNRKSHSEGNKHITNSDL
jgi:hypothetical protein